MRSLVAVLLMLWALSSSAELYIQKPGDIALIEEARRVLGHREELERIEGKMRRAAGGETLQNIVFQQCGYVNASFQPVTKNIVICFEYLRELRKRGRGSPKETEDEDMFFSILWTIYHELGHAVMMAKGGVRVFQNEEDSADAFAAVLVTKTSEKGKFLSALLNVQMKGALGRDAVDAVFGKDNEHDWATKRRSNVLCWIAGDSIDAMQYLSRKRYISESRAAGCQAESEQVKRRVQEIIEM